MKPHLTRNLIASQIATTLALRDKEEILVMLEEFKRHWSEIGLGWKRISVVWVAICGLFFISMLAVNLTEYNKNVRDRIFDIRESQYRDCIWDLRSPGLILLDGGYNPPREHELKCRANLMNFRIRDSNRSHIYATEFSIAVSHALLYSIPLLIAPIIIYIVACIFDWIKRGFKSM